MSTLNRVQNELNLRGLLDLHRKEIFLGMNCHGIARVSSFNAEKQTLQGSMVYSQTFYKVVKGGKYVPVLVDYPVLIDVPVFVLSGGNGALTMPIKAGDEALICFNDRDIDNWFAGASAGSPKTARLHSFADGIAIVGLRSAQRSIEDYDPDRVELRHGAMLVSLSEEKIKIQNAATSLLTVIDGLITILATAFGVANASPNSAAVAALNAHKLVVQELLE